MVMNFYLYDLHIMHFDPDNHTLTAGIDDDGMTTLNQYDFTAYELNEFVKFLNLCRLHSAGIIIELNDVIITL